METLQRRAHVQFPMLPPRRGGVLFEIESRMLDATVRYDVALALLCTSR